MENIESAEKIHRVGTVTLGISLIVSGIVCFLRVFIPKIPAGIVLHLWPLMMIMLGVEVLLSCTGKKKFVIDKISIVMLVLLVFFIGCMACTEAFVNYFQPHI
ncbi:MAG: hypothetical protein IJ930_04280 [Lachnospiraceae bacterium]|nr:hypothetical protein [Lachnospiraceae bacterium]